MFGPAKRSPYSDSPGAGRSGARNRWRRVFPPPSRTALGPI